MSLGIVFHAAPPWLRAARGFVWLALAPAPAASNRPARSPAPACWAPWCCRASACSSAGRWPVGGHLAGHGGVLAGKPAAHRRSATAAARRHHRQRPGGASQGQFVPHANDAWLRAHLLIALAAYGLITIAALHAMLMALLEPPGRAGRARMIGRVLDSAAAGAGAPAVRDHLDRLRRVLAVVGSIARSSSPARSCPSTTRPSSRCCPGRPSACCCWAATSGAGAAGWRCAGR